MLKKRGLVLCALLLIAFSFRCKKGDEQLKADIVVGENVKLANGGFRNLEEGDLLEEGDTIIAGADSKVKISCGSGYIYLNSNSKMGIGAMTKQNDSYRLRIVLVEGELFFTLQKQNGKTGSHIFISQGITVAAGGALNIRSSRDEVMIVQLSGSSLITALDTEERLITPCNRLVIRGNRKNRAETVFQPDIDKLKQWVGNTVIDAALSVSNCTPQNQAAKNFPPEWVRLPDEAGEQVTDTVPAIRTTR